MYPKKATKVGTTDKPSQPASREASTMLTEVSVAAAVPLAASAEVNPAGTSLSNRVRPPQPTSPLATPTAAMHYHALSGVSYASSSASNTNPSMTGPTLYGAAPLPPPPAYGAGAVPPAYAYHSATPSFGSASRVGMSSSMAPPPPPPPLPPNLHPAAALRLPGAPPYPAAAPSLEMPSSPMASEGYAMACGSVGLVQPHPGTTMPPPAAALGNGAALLSPANPCGGMAVRHGVHPYAMEEAKLCGVELPLQGQPPPSYAEHYADGAMGADFAPHPCAAPLQPDLTVVEPAATACAVPPPVMTMPMPSTPQHVSRSSSSAVSQNGFVEGAPGVGQASSSAQAGAAVTTVQQFEARYQYLYEEFRKLNRSRVKLLEEMERYRREQQPLRDELAFYHDRVVSAAAEKEQLLTHYRGDVMCLLSVVDRLARHAATLRQGSAVPPSDATDDVPPSHDTTTVTTGHSEGTTQGLHAMRPALREIEMALRDMDADAAPGAVEERLRWLCRTLHLHFAENDSQVVLGTDSAPAASAKTTSSASTQATGKSSPALHSAEPTAGVSLRVCPVALRDELLAAGQRARQELSSCLALMDYGLPLSTTGTCDLQLELEVHHCHEHAVSQLLNETKGPSAQTKNGTADGAPREPLPAQP